MLEEQVHVEYLKIKFQREKKVERLFLTSYFVKK
jgi:hypothetical protein